MARRKSTTTQPAGEQPIDNTQYLDDGQSASTEDEPAQPETTPETTTMDTPLSIICAKHSFDINDLPESLSVLDKGLAAYVVDTASEVPDIRSSASMQLESCYRQALKQQGTLAVAALDLISQYFIDGRYAAFAAVRVNAPRTMALTRRPIPASQFMLSMSRLFLALAKDDKATVRTLIDLQRLTAPITDEQGRQTVISYMSR